MARIDFYHIDPAEKAAIFKEIATQKGMKPFAVEKDWWVSRTLNIIFQMDIAKRTFLEKLFLLHEEFYRPMEKMRVDRLSRHLYDIYHLTKAGIAANTINDKELYETIVSHRYKFSRVGEVDYNLHNPKTLNPIPPQEVIADWKTDYAKMKEVMIYEEKKPSFDDLINNLMGLRKQLQVLDWQFESNHQPPITNHQSTTNNQPPTA